MNLPRLPRRQFLRDSSLAAAGLAFAGCATSQPARRTVSPNEKLNLGVIGVAGRGGENLAGIKGENLVAFCDVNRQLLGAAAAKFPAAATYTDWRKMLDRTDLDGVVISTPDHNHAIIAVAALQSGRHVYCEKPLTHTLSESRRLAEVAARSGLVTQTGNQIHAEDNYRRVVELVQGGALGTVTEVHHWAGSPWETKALPPAQPVPADLDYDQWIGPVTWRDYSSEWVPFNWRRWWHFGGGTLSDFCCHHTDLGVWALRLGTPSRIVSEGPTPDAECVPPWLKVRYEFAATDVAPATTMYWYSGSKRPEVPGTPDLSKWGGGTLFVGAKGMLLADYGRHLLLPEDKFKDFQRPAPSLAKSVGHHQEWIRACKGENLALPQFARWGRTNSPFAYGTLLTELGQLGNLAFRTDQPIEWDPVRLRAKGVPAADRFIHHEYRRGWKLG
jgi:predicted dehydrogenase